MTKIEIVSGFLGAGKTTLLKKLISEAYQGEQLVLIENEFGEIGIDGGFLKDAGIRVNEMNSGCICCSLVGDFAKALEQVLSEYHPDRILIEPSGVGKLSDVVKAVEPVLNEDVVLNTCTTVADVTKCKLYLKNFGEFYENQVKHANTIVLSRTGSAREEKIAECITLLRTLNAEANIITTPWEELDGKQLLAALEETNTTARLFEAWQEEAVCPTCGHIHHHDHEDDHCDCHDHEHHHHHDHDDDHCDCHDHEHHHHHDHEDDHCDCHDHAHHHHHDHDDDHCDCHDHEHHHHHDHEDDHCDCHDHEHHHHDHDEHCTCGCHDHDHHHHHADEVFTSYGAETAHRYTEAELIQALEALDSGRYGAVLRAKGIVAGNDGRWLHFDYVPAEHNVRFGASETIGRLCIIGADLKEADLRTLFSL